jgi:signal transduction histidine kinase
VKVDSDLPIRATVVAVEDRGLVVRLPSGSHGIVPLSEVFPNGDATVHFSAVASLPPFVIGIGDTVPVVALEGGLYSRTQAVLQAIAALVRDQEVDVTIAQITSTKIVCIADDGFQVSLDRIATEKLLKKQFTNPRLTPERESASTDRETQWLYAGDRVRVSIRQSATKYETTGILVIQPQVPPVESDKDWQDPFSPANGPWGTYEEILLLDDDENIRRLLDGYYDGTEIRVSWVSSVVECSRWRKAHIDRDLQMQTYQNDSQQVRLEPRLLAVISTKPGIDHEHACQQIGNMPGTDIVLCCSDRNEAELLQQQLDAGQLHRAVRGMWNTDTGPETFDAIVFGHGADINSRRQGALVAASPNTSRFASGSERQGHCTAVLQRLVDIAGPDAAPCTSILFRIHRRSHRVSIVSYAGDDKLARGFSALVHHLHKSPVRDLAIHCEPADIGNATTAVGRYLYFLNAAGGLHEPLCVKGIRPETPAHSQYAYAAFVLSRRPGSLLNNSRMTRDLLEAIQAWLGFAVLEESRAIRNQNVLLRAEHSTDYQYMAHELGGHLSDIALALKNVDLTEGLTNDLLAKLRTHAEAGQSILHQMLPHGKVCFTQFGPVGIANHNITQRHVAPSVQCTVVDCVGLAESTLVTGNQLAFECTLRNLIQNASQQLVEYCGGGRVGVTLKLTRKRSGLSELELRVSENGPGIHRAYWKAIFDRGFSTRPNGTGLGLAVSRRLVQDAGGTLEVVDSLVYAGTCFRMRLPVESQRVSV